MVIYQNLTFALSDKIHILQDSSAPLSHRKPQNKTCPPPPNRFKVHTIQTRLEGVARDEPPEMIAWVEKVPVTATKRVGEGGEGGGKREGYWSFRVLLGEGV